MKVLEALRETQEQLAQAGQQEHLRKAKLLLAFVMECEPAELALCGQKELDIAQMRRLRGLSDRLIGGQPLQYVLGEAAFMGLDFAVGPGVLIPRTDTEILAERAISLLKDHTCPLIADICTGSGALAVSLAHYLPQAEVYAVDISPTALEYARRNAHSNQVEGRCHFLCGDLLAPLAGLGLCFNLIICNPPYVTRAEMAELAPEIRQEPCLALYGGGDGLDFYRRLAMEAAPLLHPGGYMLLEHGWQQQEQLAALLVAEGWRILEKLNDYGGRARAVLAQALALKP